MAERPAEVKQVERRDVKRHSYDVFPDVGDLRGSGHLPHLGGELLKLGLDRPGGPLPAPHRAQTCKIDLSAFVNNARLYKLSLFSIRKIKRLEFIEILAQRFSPFFFFSLEVFFFPIKIIFLYFI